MQLRPPATPLVAVDPYFSVWSMADRLNDDTTRHWTGTPHPLAGLVRIDGTTYRLMGKEPGHLPAMAQASLRVLPTRTVYTFEEAGVTLTLTFMTPSIPSDLMLMSRPVTYLTWEAESYDGNAHDIWVYFDASPDLVVNDHYQRVQGSRFAVNGLTALRLGSREQRVLEKWGDNLRIEWGYLYAVPSMEGVQSVDTAIGKVGECRALFAKGLPLPDADDMSTENDTWNSPGIAMAFDLGAIRPGAKASCRLTLAFDDIWSVEYLNRRLKGYWTKDGMTIGQLLTVSEREYPEILARCMALDTELMADCARAGGNGYADLCALSFRQCLAAHKLVADVDGTPLFLSKENFSNGCIATVDVTYPAAPFYLLMQPALLAGCIIPILEYASLPRWKFPFAPHDLGTYPLANGQRYGGGETSEVDQMPVEECGNMLVLVAALAKGTGDLALAAKYRGLLGTWAEYLASKGLDPEHQLCTDDFAGHLAHNVNLSLKAIVAMAAYAWLAGELGDRDEAAKYRAIAEDYTKRWMEMADDGDHYRLTFDGPGTWSQKYNLVWDSLLGLDLFPKEVAQKEIAHYLTRQNRYGLPLDSRKTFSKLDWIVWTATLAEDEGDFNALIEPLTAFMNETPDRVPLSDWIETSDARHYHFRARSVVGGVFIKLLKDPGLWRKWSTRSE